MNLKKILHGAAVVAVIAVTAAFAADWPNYHGPDRTNKSKETGLLKQWPKEGPKLLWAAEGLGEGYCGVSTADGMIYTAGVKDTANYVYAYDRNGKIVWEKKAGAPWEATRASWARAYTGTRSTPTVSQGIVYYLSDTGLLMAFDAKTGDEKWSLDIREKYEAEMPLYGYSESPLIVGERLYVAPYGKTVTAICLNKKTGEVIWEGGRAGRKGSEDYAGYASFVLVENSGIKQLIAFTNHFIYGMNADNGKVLWSEAFRNARDNNCTDIVHADGHVFASTGYGRGSMLLKLGKSGDSATVQKVYDIALMDNHHGGVILHEGHVYGSGHEGLGGWFCKEFKTGKMRWNHRDGGKGSMTFADGMLYLYNEKGTMTLVKLAPEKYTEISTFKVPEGGKGAYWAHPVVSHGVLYLRHADKLYAYNVKR